MPIQPNRRQKKSRNYQRLHDVVSHNLFLNSALDHDVSYTTKSTLYRDLQAKYDSLIFNSAIPVNPTNSVPRDGIIRRRVRRATENASTKISRHATRSKNASKQSNSQVEQLVMRGAKRKFVNTLPTTPNSNQKGNVMNQTFSYQQKLSSVDHMQGRKCPQTRQDHKRTGLLQIGEAISKNGDCDSKLPELRNLRNLRGMRSQKLAQM